MAYDGAVASQRLYAHRVADDIHWQQRALRGVAQTKLTFSSDRVGDRIGGSIENRSVKEIMHRGLRRRERQRRSPPIAR